MGDAEAPRGREAGGEGDAHSARARDGHLRLALLGEFLQGRAVVWLRGARLGTGRPAPGEVQLGERRQRLHAVLLGTQDRRVRDASRAAHTGIAPTLVLLAGAPVPLRAGLSSWCCVLDRQRVWLEWSLGGWASPFGLSPCTQWRGVRAE